MIKVLGIGGAGSNAVNRMISAGLEGVEFIAINTDEQVLTKSSATYCIPIGQKITKGMGAGGDPEMGQRAAMEDQDQLEQVLRGADMVFITAGMGGGTGTGAAPIVAELARGQGALTVGVITLPFSMEGKRRLLSANQGLEVLRNKVDTLIIIRNDSIFKIIDQKTSVDIAFQIVDDILLNAVRGISDLINTAGLVNVDFADVRAIMSETGDAVMGAGEGVGEDRAAKAVNQAIHNALLEDTGIEGATAVLINVCGSEKISMTEWKDVSELITRHVHSEANIIIGLTLDPSLADRLRVTVIATGFRKEVKKMSNRLGSQHIQQKASGEYPISHPLPSWNIDISEQLVGDETKPTHHDLSSNSSSHSPLMTKQGFSQTPFSQEEYKALQHSNKLHPSNRKESIQEPDISELDIPAFLRRKKP